MCATEVGGLAFPGGYCTIDRCDERGCPEGAICADVEVPDGTVDFCMRTCSAPEECRTAEGYTCAGGVCLPPG